MKKMLAVVLSAAMVMSMSTAVFADTTLEGNSGTTNVIYTTEESYTVTIPADIALKDDYFESSEVKVTNALLADSSVLAITVSSENNYKLKCGDSAIDYTLTGDDRITEENNEVLRVTSGVKVTDVNSQELDFETSEEAVKAATLAGEHKDTLTFNVSLTRDGEA